MSAPTFNFTCEQHVSLLLIESLAMLFCDFELKLDKKRNRKNKENRIVFVIELSVFKFEAKVDPYYNACNRIKLEILLGNISRE